MFKRNWSSKILASIWLYSDKFSKQRTKCRCKALGLTFSIPSLVSAHCWYGATRYIWNIWNSQSLHFERNGEIKINRMCVESKCIHWERGAEARVMEQVLNGAEIGDRSEEWAERKVHRDQENQYSMETAAELCLQLLDAARRGKCKQSKKSPPHCSPASPELGTLPGAVTMCPI